MLLTQEMIWPKKSSDVFFTAGHEKLLRIASFANFFAWVTLIFQSLYFALSVFNATQNLAMENVFRDPVDTTLLSYTALILNSLANLFLRGVFYWLVLKGISVGLKMIVETDLNYRGKAQQEASHE